MNQFSTDLNKNKANYVPLTPLSFITRAKDIYPNYESVVYGDRSYTWLETYNRCSKFASALTKKGIGLGSTVSIIAANTPELLEAHYSIPMTGGVVNTINTRLDAQTIAYILEHSDAKLLITDTQFSPTIKKALSIFGKKIPKNSHSAGQPSAPFGGGLTAFFPSVFRCHMCYKLGRCFLQLEFRFKYRT